MNSSIVFGDDGDKLAPPLADVVAFKDLKLDLLGALSGANNVDEVIKALRTSALPVDIKEDDEVFRAKFSIKPSDGTATTNPSITSIDDILLKLRNSFQQKGAHGIAGSMRLFKKLDSNGNGSLDFKEFMSGVQSCKLDLNHSDVKALFKNFDKNCDGHLDIEEFLAGICGNLSDKRKVFVDKAFDLMDKDKSGTLDIKDLVSRYDTSKHPEVIAGNMTAAQVYKEFLDSFDGGVKDGLVTREEFITYYQGVSAGIPNDDYFELMMRNAWHISGGEGWAQNTTCLRVLVTHEDGHQTVEEITDDFDIAKEDIAAMKANLAARGIKATKISVTGDINEPTPEMSEEPTISERSAYRYGRGAGQSSITFG
eukprot:CAMPEP_0196585132 /NCGR_PEP_ID=MMETSP1081-20130531/49609_1 /TAXON_ID=36882 /ORGANISM="Pyramimonas amylifera, Strain CCMP720" /LENGTH=367 /DNA_ID=CAMNT_0041906583 /DNA_START=75 /DNA_END=1178 /DNA_ORIENTATION=+